MAEFETVTLDDLDTIGQDSADADIPELKSVQPDEIRYERPGFLQSLEAGIDNLQLALGPAQKAGFTKVFGDEVDQLVAVSKFNQKQEEISELLKGATDWREILEADSLSEGGRRFLDYATEQIGLNSPQMAAIIAGGVAGSAAAPYLPHPGATAISKGAGFAAGSIMAALPVFGGFNLSRQIEEGQEPDLVKAYSLAVPQAGVEALFAGVLAKVGKPLTPFFSKTSSTRLGRMAQKVTEAMAVGVPGEAAQQALERQAADLELDTPEAFEEYLDSAIAAGVLAGGGGMLAGIPKGTPLSVKKDYEKVFAEEIAGAPEPKSTLIQSEEEANALLTSVNVDPVSIPASGRVKLSNIFIDRSEANRLDYSKRFFNTLQEDIRAGQPLNTFPLTNPLENLKAKLQFKQPVFSSDLESISQKDLPDMADAIITDPLPETIGAPLDVEARTDVLKEYGRGIAQIEDKRLTGQPQPNVPTITRVPGQINVSPELQEKEFKRLMRLRAPELREEALKSGLPEDKIQKESGQFRTKEQVARDLVEHRQERIRQGGRILEQDPITDVPEDGNVPLNRITTPEQNLADIGSREISFTPEKLESLKPSIANFKTLAKDTGAVDENMLDISRDLTNVDQDTNKVNPLKPVKAISQANLFFTALNFNNVVGYSNMDNSFIEAFHYFYNKVLSDKDIKKLDVHKAVGYKALDSIHKSDLERMTDTREGQAELLGYVFSDFARAVREKDGALLEQIPKDFKPSFNKLVNFLKRLDSSLRAQGLESYEDIYDGSERPARQVLEDGLDNLRYARLRKMSLQVRQNHFDMLDSEKLDDLVKMAMNKQENMEVPRGFATAPALYNRFAATVSHKASKHPIWAVPYQLLRTENDISARIMNLLEEKRAALKGLSADHIWQAHEILDHLRRTDQDITENEDGSVSYFRDENLMRVSDPDGVRAIKGIREYYKTVLGQAEIFLKNTLKEYFPDIVSYGINELEASYKVMEKEKVFPQEDLDFIKDRINDLQAIESYKTKAYVPRMRFGPYAVTVYRKTDLTRHGNPKKDAEPAFHYHIEEGSHLGKFHKGQYEELQERLKEYDTGTYKIFEPFRLTQSGAMNNLSNTQLTFDMLSSLISTRDEEAYVRIKNRLTNDLKTRGFAKRFTDSRDIEGYSTDWLRVMDSYGTGAAHYFARQSIRPHLDSFKNKLQGMKGQEEGALRTSSIVKDVENYLDYMQSPHDEWQKVRNLNFVYALGLNASTAVLQVFTLPTTTLGGMSQFDPNIVKNMARLGKYFTLAMKEFGLFYSAHEGGGVLVQTGNREALDKMVKKGQITKEMRDLSIKAFSTGRSGQLFVEEQSGSAGFDQRTLGGKTQKKLTTLSHLTGIPIGVMEQITRWASLMASMDMLQKNPGALQRLNRVLKDDQRWQAQRALSNNNLMEDGAFFILDEAHAVFGKAGRSNWLRGFAGSFLFPFMTYPMSAVELIGRMFGRGKEGQRAALATLGSLWVFAGLLGLPGGELFKELYEELHKSLSGKKIDLDQEIRRAMYDMTGNEKFGVMITQGAPRAFWNAQGTYRIGLPLIGQDLVLATLGIRGDMTELFGVQGSIAENAVRAWSAYREDQSGMKLGELLTPTAISNVFKAYNYTREGVITRGGRQLITPEEILDNPKEIILRALGITTDRVASAREAEYYRLLENNRIRPKMDAFRNRGKRIMSEYYRALTKGDDNLAEKKYNEYNKLMDEVWEWSEKNNPFFNMAAFNRSVLDAADQRLLGQVRVKDLNKSVRHKLPEIKTLSGRAKYEEN